MKPIYLEMNAFGPYAGKQVVDFTCLENRNLFLIYGPTGSGKTTILDAMCYALYGDTSGNRRSGAHMRSEYATPTEVTTVTFRFAIGEKQYVIERSPEQQVAKKKGTGLKKMASSASLSTCRADGTIDNVIATKNVTADVERLLGFKSEQFRQVVLLPQGDFRKLLLANSSERQQIMQILFHTQRYASLQDIAKAKYDAVEQAYHTIQQRVEQMLEGMGLADEAALMEQIETLTEKKRENEAQQKKADADKGAYEKLVRQMEILYNHWQTFKQKQQEAAELLQRHDEFEAKRRHIEELRRAEVLADAFKQNDETRAMGEAARKKADEGAAAFKRAEAYVDKLQTHDRALKDEEPKRQGEKETITTLKSLLPKVKEYSALCLDEVRIRRHARQTEAAWKSLQMQCQTGQEAIEKSRAFLAHKADWAAALEHAKHKVSQLQERWNQEIALENMEKDLAKQKTALGEMKAKERQATKLAGESRLNYEAVQSLFLQGQASLLASQLEEGMPCPVCGAVHHPQLAAHHDDMPTKEAVELRKRDAEEKEQLRQQWALKTKEQETAMEAVQGQYDALRKQYPKEDSAKAWEQQFHDWEQQVAVHTEHIQKAEKIQADLEVLAQQQQRLTKQEEEARQAAQAADRESVRMAEGKKRAEADIPEAYRQEAVIEAEIHRLMTSQQQYEEAVEKSRKALGEGEKKKATAEALKKTLQDNVEALREKFVKEHEALKIRVAEAGFASVAACRALQQYVPFIPQYEQAVAAYDKQVQQVQGQLEQEEKAIEKREEPCMDDYTKELQAKNEVCRNLTTAGAEIAAHHKRAVQLQQQIGTWKEEQQLLSEQYKTIGAVYELIAGKQSGVNFERYVLGALLDEVLLAANIRLGDMSRHRYELQRSTAWGDRRVKQIGLDIEVFDNYTGYARPANTLSGGETFLASLSLALGLADVVQTYSGGIHLDTIFIDEGFGTLDSETLDFALKALLKLNEGGRLVGIISHVPELQERIDTRLAIIKTDRGSMAAFELL